MLNSNYNFNYSRFEIDANGDNNNLLEREEDDESRVFFFFFRSLWGRNESRIRNKLVNFHNEIVQRRIRREREKERGGAIFDRSTN